MEPLVIAIIAGVASVVGGVVGGLIRPWGDNWVAAKAAERTTAADAVRLRRERLERMQELLAWLAFDGISLQLEEAKRSARGVAAAVNDETLLVQVERLLDTPRMTSEWWQLHGEAQKRAGHLLATLR